METFILPLNTSSNNDSGNSVSSDEYFTLVIGGTAPERQDPIGWIYIQTGRACGRNGCLHRIWGMPDEPRPLDVGAMKEQTDKAIEVPSDTVSVLDEKNLLVTEGAVFISTIWIRRKKRNFSAGWTVIFPAPA